VHQRGITKAITRSTSVCVWSVDACIVNALFRHFHLCFIWPTPATLHLHRPSDIGWQGHRLTLARCFFFTLVRFCFRFPYRSATAVTAKWVIQCEPTMTRLRLVCHVLKKDWLQFNKLLIIFCGQVTGTLKSKRVDIFYKFIFSRFVETRNIDAI